MSQLVVRQRSYTHKIMKLDTPDELFRATTPNAIRAISDDELDSASNAAHSFLRQTDDGVLRQVDERIKAIALEWARRRAKWPFRLSALALIVSIGSLIVVLLNRIYPPAPNPIPPPLTTHTQPPKTQLEPKIP